MHRSGSMVGLSMEATATDEICQIFHLIFSVFPLIVVVAAPAVVVILMAVVTAMEVVAVSSINCLLYIVCIRPHYTCTVRHIGQYYLHFT
jgi:hypothetical protein